MRKLLILGVLLLCMQTLQAGIFLKVSLADTAATYNVMRSLSGLENITRFQIVFPENLKAQEATLQAQFHLSDYPKATMLFNTSFYNYLHSKNEGSCVFYINGKGTIVYQSALATFRPEAMAYYTRYNDKIISQFRVPKNVVMPEPTHGDYTLYYYVDDIRKNILLDLKNGIEYDLSFQDTIVERLYKKLLGQRFAKRWPGIKEFLQEYKGWQPEMWHIRKMPNSNEMLEYIILRDTMINAKGDTVVFGESMLVKYNLETKQFGEAYLEPDMRYLNVNNVYPAQIEYINDKLYVLFSHTHKSTNEFEYCAINFNEQNKTYSKSNNCLPTCYSAGYLKKISSVVSMSFVNDGHAIAYMFADSLYDFAMKKFIKIPIPPSPTGQSVEYEIVGLRCNLVTANYHIVYYEKETKQLNFLVFNKASEVIINEKIDGERGDLISPYQLLQYDAKNEQYRLIDL